MAEVLTNYELRNKRKAFTGELNGLDANGVEETTKDKFKSTAEGLGRDLLIGVIGGGLAGAILGRYSFLLGLGVAGFGHYSESKTMTALGLGMMASGTFHALTGKDQDPKKPLLEKVTERVEAFKNDMKRKLWVDKFYENKASKDKTNTTTDNVNGIQSETTTKTEKEVSASNNVDVSDLTSEEQAFLEKEIEETVDAKINEFMMKKKNQKTATAKEKQATNKNEGNTNQLVHEQKTSTDSNKTYSDADELNTTERIY